VTICTCVNVLIRESLVIVGGRVSVIVARTDCVKVVVVVWLSRSVRVAACVVVDERVVVIVL
jgi:hypothetical protein